MAVAEKPVDQQATEEKPVALRDWGILRDIPFKLTVEVGRTRMKVRDILALEIGSLVTSNKLSGEAMDISLNTEIFGRSEVIIIKDKLWARLTKIAGGDA